VNFQIITIDSEEMQITSGGGVYMQYAVKIVLEAL
jgi:hypothetical protein